METQSRMRYVTATWEADQILFEYISSLCFAFVIWWCPLLTLGDPGLPLAAFSDRTQYRIVGTVRSTVYSSILTNIEKY